MGGDFNARNIEWNDDSCNKNGIILHNLCLKSNLSVLSPASPTCFRAENGSFIDFFITNNTEHLHLSKVTNIPSFSDHTAIHINIINVHTNTISLTHRKIFNFARIKPLNKFITEKFEDLNIPNNHNISNDEIDDITAKFESIFIEAVDGFVPTTTEDTFKIRFSQNTKILLAHSKRLQRRIHRNFLIVSEINRGIHNELKLTKIALRNAVQQDVHNYYANEIANSDFHQNIHGTVKTCTSYKKKNTAISNLEDSDGNRIDDSDLPELFGKHFVKNHELTHGWQSDMDNNVNAVVDEAIGCTGDQIVFTDEITAEISDIHCLNEIEEKLPEHQRNRLTNTREVINIIKSRRIKKKSSGCDSLPLYIMQFLTINIIAKIAIVFNHCMANGYFPKAWKFALIVPIQKANKNNRLMANYRPISMLPAISKLFEGVALIRMKRVSNMSNFENQYGFKNNCSTIHPLSIIHDTVAGGLNNSQFTTLVSLDIKAAFDTVWLRGLLYKLSLHGFNSFWLKLINSFLTDRKFAVKIGNTISSSFDVVAGTPQGAILSPYFFNHYIADIPTDSFVKTNQFADDTAIFATHFNHTTVQNAINKHLFRLSVWFRRWKLKVNASKTEAIHFVGIKSIPAALRKKIYDMQLNFNGFTFRGRDKIRYLGMHFDKFFKYNHHIDTIMAKAERSRGALSRLIGSRLINTKLKNLIYKSYIRPIITYASEIWAGSKSITAHKFESLRIFERKIIRKTSNIFRRRGCFLFAKNIKLYEAANIPRLDQFITKNILNHFRRCETSAADNIKQTADARFDLNAKYKNCAYLFALNKNNNLLTDGKLLIFNRNKNNDIKYSVDQPPRFSELTISS